MNKIQIGALAISLITMIGCETYSPQNVGYITHDTTLSEPYAKSQTPTFSYSLDDIARCLDLPKPKPGLWWDPTRVLVVVAHCKHEFNPHIFDWNLPIECQMATYTSTNRPSEITCVIMWKGKSQTGTSATATGVIPGVPITDLQQMGASDTQTGTSITTAAFIYTGSRMIGADEVRFYVAPLSTTSLISLWKNMAEGFYATEMLDVASRADISGWTKFEVRE